MNTVSKIIIIFLCVLALGALLWKLTFRSKPDVTENGRAQTTGVTARNGIASENTIALEPSVIAADGFEIGTNSPLGWTNYASASTGRAEFRWDDQVAHSGRRSIYIKSEGPRSVLWQKDFPVVGGAEYEFKVWARVRNGRGKTCIGGRSRDAKGAFIVGSGIGSTDQDIFLTANAEWTLLKYRARTPPAAHTVSLFLLNSYGKGDEVWFDDLEISDTIPEDFKALYPRILSTLKTDGSFLKSSLPAESPLRQEIESFPGDQPGAAGPTTGSSDMTTVEQRRAAWQLLTRGINLERKVKRAAFLQRMRYAEPELGAVWVDAMERVFLDDLPIAGETSTSGSITAFRGEREAAQLVLVPMRDFTNVSVKVISPPDAAQRLPDGAVQCKVVGYVKIEKPSRNWLQMDPFPYAGWWPDPLLDRAAFPLQAGTFQPVWVEVKVPVDQAPGLYSLQLVIEEAVADAKKVVQKTTLSVKIFPGRLPQAWHMKKFLCFSDRKAHDNGGKKASKLIFYGQRWAEVAPRYHQLLFDYRIGIGSLNDKLDTYPPELLQEAVARGQNVFLHPGVQSACLDDQGKPALRKGDSEVLEKALTTTIPWLRQIGLLSRAYFYGFDENPPDFLPLCRDTFLRVKASGIRTMSTVNDETYGTDSVLGGAVDAFMPQCGRYNRDLARKARAQGREVWWYSAWDFNIETDPYYQRQRAWRTLSEEADGYLIWCMNRWTGNDRFISDAIRSEWNANLDNNARSSAGMMIYPGKDGPVTSLRLEHFRDGVEDYDLLAQAALNMKKPGETFQAASRKVLEAVGLPEVSVSLTPRQIRAAREKLGILMKDD